MDHNSTRALLEEAAIEPDGVDRLMAGDTAPAQAVAGHLAGCPECTDELMRLQRASSVIRSVVRGMPPAELRERTLATVAAIGVPRGDAAAAVSQRSPAGTESAAGPADGPGTTESAAGPGTNDRATASDATTTRLDRRLIAGWVATIAAGVLLSVGSTVLIVESRVSDRLTAQSTSLAALSDATIAALSIEAQPDATLVTLNGTTGPQPGGRLSFSPSTKQLVLVANGLPQPSPGQEYRAWVEVGGQRQRVGRLTFTDGVAYWSGQAPAVAGLHGPARFGVSLVDSAATGGAPPAVLLGEN